MLTSLWLFALALFTVVQSQSPPSRCWSSGNNQPARWWEEGERIDRGRYWYECRSGELIPKGCFSETQQRLNIGESYVDEEYQVTCEKGNDGYLKFQQTACIGPNGERFQPGESWVDSTNTYYYECKQEGNYIRSQIAGCISHDKNTRLAIGEKVDHEEYTYECLRKYNGSVQMCSVGCVHDGRRYAIGEQWPAGEYIFYCNKQGGRSQKICVGCQYRQKRLYDGDRYQKDRTVYQCQIREDSYGHKPVGCVSMETDGTTIERVVGCRWYIHGQSSKVEQTCLLEGEKTRVDTIGCIYRYRGYDTIWLFPGTYTIWNQPDGINMGLACTKTADGARLENFPAEQVASYSSRLKYDMPRGK